MTSGSTDGSLNAINENEAGMVQVNGARATKSSAIVHPSLVLRDKNASDPPSPENLGLKDGLPGWNGYVEWEICLERKKKAEECLKKFDFPGVNAAFSSLFRAWVLGRL